MSRRLAVAVAGLAAATSLAALVPAHAEEPEAVGDAVALADAFAGFTLGLANSMVWVPPWATDPEYPKKVVDAVPVIVDGSVDLATSIVPPLQPWTTDPEYYKHAAEIAPSLAVAIAEKAATEHYGGGAFTGTVAWEAPIPPEVEECRVDRAAVRGTVAITADVAFTVDATTFTGPLAITGTACGASIRWLGVNWTASGTDSLGNTFHCPSLGGVARWWDYWSANVVGGGCTVNGVALPGTVQLFMAGEHVSVAPTTGSLAGTLTVNTY